MEMLRFATAGSVDDGKSTLIGRLLLDTKQIFEDQLEAVERTSREKGFDYTNLALLTDGLRAEREQGITIDVAYRYFATPRRKFIIADTPGHVQYTRNMVTGASTADLALVLRRRAQGRARAVAAPRGDRVAAAGEAPRALRQQDGPRRLRPADASTDLATSSPSSRPSSRSTTSRSSRSRRSHGDNVTAALAEHAVVRGPDAAAPPRARLHRLRPQPHRRPLPGAVRHAADVRRAPRLPGLRRPGRGRHLPARRRGDGAARPGSPRRSPGSTSTAASSTRRCRRCRSTLRLADELDISRGDMICRPHNTPTVTQDVDAMVCWFSERPLQRARPVRHQAHDPYGEGAWCATCTTGSTSTRSTATRRTSSLAMNDIGRVSLRTTVPLFVDEYRRNRITGSFILIDEGTNETVGARAWCSARPGSSPPAAMGDAAQSPNVVWHARTVTREARWARPALDGATVWFTGLSGSGKSTIARRARRSSSSRAGCPRTRSTATTCATG